MRSDASLVTSLPPDLAALATDPRLSLHDGRFHEFTVDTRDDGRFVLRLRLWPFYQFAIEFSRFSLVEVPMADRRAARPGRFTFVSHPE